MTLEQAQDPQYFRRLRDAVLMELGDNWNSHWEFVGHRDWHMFTVGVARRLGMTAEALEDPWVRQGFESLLLTARQELVQRGLIQTA
jgi:hypothetical protein